MAARSGGLDWTLLTYRELVHAFESKRMDDWDRVADTVAHIVQCWIPKDMVATREMFHPFREHTGPVSTVPLDDPEQHHNRLLEQEMRKAGLV